LSTSHDLSGHLIVRFSVGGTTITKDLSASTSVTTFTSGGDRMALRNDGRSVSVTSRAGTTRASVSDRAQLAAVFQQVKGSKAVDAARHALEQVSLQPESVEGNAMLLTRAMLGSVWGDEGPAHAYQQWMAAKAAQPRFIRAGGLTGPGDCWDQYAAEAIRIANDYIDCANSCEWLFSLCLDGCGVIYEIRAEAAFMWFLHCSGGFFVS
jgi:hypothetical protein